MNKSLAKINLVKNKLNKTLTNLAVDLGYSYPVISRLFSGKEKITKKFIYNFIAKYDVNPLWFFEDVSPIFLAPQEEKSAEDGAKPSEAKRAPASDRVSDPAADSAVPQASPQAGSFASLPKGTRALLKIFNRLPIKYKKRIFEFARSEDEEYRELLRKEAEEQEQLKEMFENRIPIEETIPVPVVGEVSAGIPSYSEENIIEYLDYDASMVKNPKNFFFLKIRGDSMIECRIFHGDYILIQKETHYRSGDIVVARIEDDLTVKKVRFLRESEKIELIPCNPNYETLTYDAREVTVVGVVVAIDWRSKR